MKSFNLIPERKAVWINLSPIVTCLLFIFLAACTNPEKPKERPSGGQEFAKADWISGQYDIPEVDSLFYQDHPAPLLRKEFEIASKVKEAELLITAAGYYTVWINGEIVGDLELEPAWTDYSKRIYYQRFDVTKFLKKGSNVIGVELGNAWYNPLPLKMWGGRNIRDELNVGKPCVIARLDIDLKNKDPLVVVTDDSWKYHSGAVTRNNVYLGEYHDNRLNQNGWLLDDFDDKTWGSVQIAPPPGGELIHSFFPPIRKTKSLKPVAIWQNSPGRYTIDFGQNMAGWMRYAGPSLPGDSIIIRYGERIWPDSTLNPMTTVCGQIKRAGVGGPGAPAVAEQIDVFIPATTGDVFEPKYSFHGFRYVEVTGLGPVNGQNDLGKWIPNTDNFTAFRLGTDVKKISSFNSDQEWLNRIQEMVEWTFTSNFFSLPSDCPAREKFGYGGDLNGTAETWLYNYDMQTAFIKVIYDWKDAMREGRFVDTAPFVGISYCGIAWESVFLLLQDWLYEFYGDLDLVKDWYETDIEWIQKAISLTGSDLVKDGLSDHESLLPVPVELIGSAHYYKSLRVMEKFAGLMDKSADQQFYRTKANDFQKMMCDSLWFEPIMPIKNPQTWYSTLLYHNILPEDQKSEAIKALISEMEASEYKLTTGIFGTPYLLEVLSENGYTQQVFDMISSEEFPGWRFMLNNGATTVWETWKESDNVFSQNHPMFGVVSTWLHKWLGGFYKDCAGWEEVTLKPFVADGLNSLEVTREMKEGMLSMSWLRKDDEIRFDLDIPNGPLVRWNPILPEAFELKNGSNLDSEGFLKPGKHRIIYSRGNSLTVFHAGSLSIPMKKIAQDFMKEHSGIKVINEAAGSVTCVRKLTELNRNCDVMALADSHLIDELLIPDYANWGIQFTANELVIAFTEESAYQDELTSKSWMNILLRPDVKYGRSDPNSDPCGYRTVHCLQLAKQFYEGGVDINAFLAKDKRYIRPKETDLLSLLESDNLDYIFIYKSVAIQHGLKILLLPDEINLKSAALESFYSKASLRIKGKTPNSELLVTGRAMIYGLTVPTTAENPQLAMELVKFILDPTHGGKIFEETGQPVIRANYTPKSSVRPIDLQVNVI